jgi:hypothetical protein
MLSRMAVAGCLSGFNAYITLVERFPGFGCKTGRGKLWIKGLKTIIRDGGESFRKRNK